MTERISDESAEYYKARSTWMRGLFMLLFIALYQIAAVVISAVAVLQFAWKLLAGAPNPRRRPRHGRKQRHAANSLSLSGLTR